MKFTLITKARVCKDITSGEVRKVLARSSATSVAEAKELIRIAIRDGKSNSLYDDLHLFCDK